MDAKVLGGIAKLIAVEDEFKESGKFLWEIFIYSIKWPTNTPKGDKASVQNELFRTNH